ncbi:hypothetical protein SDC9_191241 [bioreactor metagenome]|uniref:Uncharacterized protein n=1 Tax=bioreactor metagenome TaxID=1076179 RepID=A0A645HXB9_9ZZZZ
MAYLGKKRRFTRYRYGSNRFIFNLSDDFIELLISINIRLTGFRKHDLVTEISLHDVKVIVFLKIIAVAGCCYDDHLFTGNDDNILAEHAIQQICFSLT